VTDPDTTTDPNDTAQPVPAGNGMVQIAYLHGPNVAHSFAESLRRSWQYDRNRYGDDIPSWRVLAEDPLNLRSTSGRIVQSRNFGVKLFLEKTPHEWLMWIDADMGWEPDAIHRLLEAADPQTHPIVGGLCFATYMQEADGANGYRQTYMPTMYGLGEKTTNGSQTFCFWGPYEDNTVTQVAGTGGAFVLIHRSVFERMAREMGDGCWYKEAYDGDGDIIGEDLAFCARALMLGFPVHVHTGVKTTHQKEIWLGEDAYLLQSAVPLIEQAAQGVPDNLPTAVDIPSSLASLAREDHVRPDGMLKLAEDLERYAGIIAATQPEVIVETGTRTGASAAWLHAQGPDVITVDIDPEALQKEYYDPALSYVTGDSTAPNIVEFVRTLVDGRRCMVILDSDHSSQHVGEEIALYGGLVSLGCYLVVEDGIFGYASDTLRDRHIPGQKGSPLTPISLLLAGNPEWSRDLAVERSRPISHHPAGWWVRVDTPAEDAR